jgi:hypothetical protein
VTPAVCPECRDLKHGNCIGYALGADDVVVACMCDGSDCGRAIATEVLRNLGT